ncbi:uncharacterized protein JN550_006962 [Neoarthrinium moseri]|uniref:uncharacterized protein n=1 Tax=Neoarthrinium moseri TaxID=1658444 RepID=UPI001FDD22CC|nr:uncharacterized protein JN550_006962 [Neoarthrinium moseri]KAI1867821.1 hypothetical protein JN550_006962 [Neoarthrinium moseri]
MNDPWDPDFEPCDSDFDSSDGELGKGDMSAHFTRARQREREKLLATAAEDRLSSKKFQKQLTPGTGNQNTDYAMSKWAQRFQDVREVTLKLDPKSTPSASELERFLTIIPGVIQGQGENGAISYGYLDMGLFYIKKWCEFQFPDFKVTAHDERRFTATLARLERDGVLTKERVQEAQWITSETVHLLSRSMLHDAIQNGTLSWDAIIMKTMSLILQAAVSGRAGDVRRSFRYDDPDDDDNLRCVCWEHIVMRMDFRDDQRIFTATVTLKHTKGPRVESVCHELTELVKPTLNCACPIKLVLIHALRVGAVQETSWDQLRQNTWARRSKRVVWTHPKRPVICAMGGTSRKLNLDTPSPADAAGAMLREASKAAGLLTPVTPHDIRRGAAKEMAHIGGAAASMSIEAARLALGHSYGAMKAGITERYVGHNLHDTWKARLEGNIPRSAKHTLDFSSERFTRKRLAAEQIEDSCDQNGMDPEHPPQRARAARAARMAEYQTWRDTQLRLNDSVPDGMADVPVLETQINADISGQPTSSREHAAAGVALSGERELPDLLYMGTRPVRQSSESKKTLVNAELVGEQNPLIGISDPILDAEPDVFANYLCTVNEYSVATSAPSLPFCAEAGGSRDPPTRKMHRCTKIPCNKEFLSHLDRDRHSHTCQAEMRQAFDFVCDICGGRYATEKQLQTHEAEHKWTPRHCGWPDCKEDTVFQSLDALRLHRERDHHDRPTTCFVTGCGMTFRRPNNLKKHIMEFHPDVGEEQLTQFMPKLKRQAIKKDSFKPQPCSYPGCTHQVVFGTRSQYRDHLKYHGVRGDTLDQYVKDDPGNFQATTPPRQRAAKYKPQRCSHPGCECRQRFGHRHKLVAHIREAHGATLESEFSLLIQSDPDTD